VTGTSDGTVLFAVEIEVRIGVYKSDGAGELWTLLWTGATTEGPEKPGGADRPGGARTARCGVAKLVLLLLADGERGETSLLDIQNPALQPVGAGRNEKLELSLLLANSPSILL